MGREEQDEEREVLASIFPDEITDISETSFRISIALDVPGQDEDAEKPTILLTVSYPPPYPDESPDLTITSPPSSPKHPHLTLPEDASYLLSTLSEPISESLGAAMVFTLVSALKDSAEALINTRMDYEQAAQDKERAKAEEAENAKFHGEAVTRESFMVWRSKFKEEMEREAEGRRKAEEEGKSKREVAKGEELRMTGRMLWEKGLVGKVEEEDEGVDALSGVEKLKLEG